MKKAILFLFVILVAVVGIGIAAASENVSNVNVDINAGGDHHIDSVDSSVKVADTKTPVQKDDSHSNMKVQNIEEYQKAATVSKLYGTESVGEISMELGMSPAQVLKMIDDIKAGHYGDGLKNSIVNEDH